MCTETKYIRILLSRKKEEDNELVFQWKCYPPPTFAEQRIFGICFCVIGEKKKLTFIRNHLMAAVHVSMFYFLDL